MKPRLKIKLSPFDKSVEALCWGALLALWVIVMMNYAALPDIIPTHYNVDGAVDDHGPKAAIWLLPFVASLLFISLTVLNKFPHVLNYPSSLTAENALKEYILATRTVRFIKLALTLIFGIIALNTVQFAMGKTVLLGAYFTPIAVALIFAPIIYYFVYKARTR